MISKIKHKIFWKEVAVFEKVCNRMIVRLPKDKFRHSLLKVRRYLRQVTNNLDGICKKMAEISSKKLMYNTQELKDFNYILKIFQRTALLFSKTCSFSEQTYGNLLQKLSLGHYLEGLVILSGLLSRINILCRVKIIQLCRFYRKLLSWRNEFKEENSTEHSLPNDLKIWLKKETNICFKLNRRQQLQKSCVNSSLHKMFESNTDETVDSEEELVEEEYEETLTEDIGESVPRNEIYQVKKESLKKGKWKKQLEYNQILKKEFDKVKTLKDLKLLCRKIQYQTLPCLKQYSKPLSLKYIKKMDKLIRETTNKISNLRNGKFEKEKKDGEGEIIKKAAARILNFTKKNYYAKKK